MWPRGHYYEEQSYEDSLEYQLEFDDSHYTPVLLEEQLLCFFPVIMHGTKVCPLLLQFLHPTVHHEYEEEEIQLQNRQTEHHGFLQLLHGEVLCL